MDSSSLELKNDEAPMLNNFELYDFLWLDFRRSSLLINGVYCKTIVCHSTGRTLYIHAKFHVFLWSFFRAMVNQIKSQKNKQTNKKYENNMISTSHAGLIKNCYYLILLKLLVDKWQYEEIKCIQIQEQLLK